jgi:hypothetical protein
MCGHRDCGGLFDDLIESIIEGGMFPNDPYKGRDISNYGGLAPRKRTRIGGAIRKVVVTFVTPSAPDLYVASKCVFDLDKSGRAVLHPYHTAVHCWKLLKWRMRAYTYARGGFRIEEVDQYEFWIDDTLALEVYHEGGPDDEVDPSHQDGNNEDDGNSEAEMEFEDSLKSRDRHYGGKGNVRASNYRYCIVPVTMV